MAQVNRHLQSTVRCAFANLNFAAPRFLSFGTRFVTVDPWPDVA
jgi:hypothetical protein